MSTAPDEPAGAGPEWPDARGAARLAAAARGAGVRDRRILQALARIPRSRFVPPEHAARAYEDRPVPITHGQVTSQPSLIARMVQALSLAGAERVLEVGSGYGYQTALVAMLAGEVWAVELWQDMVDAAAAALRSLGISNAHVLAGDGTLGLPAHAPFDAIVLCAAHPRVPPPLAAQLADGGRLVQPVGPGGREEVLLFRRRGGALIAEELLAPARFVRLHGAHGYPSDEEGVID